MLRKLTLSLTVLGALVAVARAEQANLAGIGGVRAEGPGIKLGESLVLHPGLGVVAGHDSNMLYSSSADPAVYGPYLGLRPVVDMSTLSMQRGGGRPHNLDFRLHLGAFGRFLLTGDQYFNRHHIGVDVDGAALLTINPFGNWVFDIFDNFNRSSFAPYFRVQQNGNVNTIDNRLGLKLRYRLPGNRLEFGLMYTFGLFAFEPDAVSALWGNKNHIFNDFQFRAQWRFFPKTSVYINVQETIYTYYLRGAQTPPNSYPLRVVAGINGLITPTLMVDLNVGYGNGFFNIPDYCTATPMQGDPERTPAMLATCATPETVVTGLNLSWKPTLTSSISIGYRHDFGPSPGGQYYPGDTPPRTGDERPIQWPAGSLIPSTIGSYYDLDQVTAAGSLMIWRLYANLRFAWQRFAFKGNTTLDNVVLDRVDNLISINFDLSYPIRDWLVVTLGDNVQINTAPSACFEFNGNISTIACDYKRNDLWLKVAVAY